MTHWFTRIITVPKQVKDWVTRNEHYLSPAALFLGFIIDNLTLTRIDLLFDNLILISYLAIALGGIIVFNLIDTGRLRGLFFTRLAPLVPLAVQFAFGGLFSGFLVFYSRSASLAGSWFFVLVLIVLLLGNETFKRQYLRFRFQMAMFYIALFSFLIFFIPVILKAIGVGVFLFSGIVSLVVMGLILYGLSFLMPEKLARAGAVAAVYVFGIYLIFNVLYFSHAIPPLPLALKDVGVYHAIERTTDGGYLVTYEPKPWYFFYKGYNPTYHRFANEPVHVFSSVFAPTQLTTTIQHRWERYDETQEQWVPEGVTTFPIIGGRDGGYRGYSTKTNLQSGSWRVTIATGIGHTIGRISFEVVPTERPPEVEQERY